MSAVFGILADLDEAEMSMLSHSQTPRGRLRLELPRRSAASMYCRSSMNS